MLTTARSLLSKGEQVIYISMDEPSVRRLEARDLAKYIRSSYPEGRVHLFLDEVQEWKDWAPKIRWLHDIKDFYLYTSGPSSSLQESDVPSRLRGRYISRLLLPLSFREVAPIEVRTFREKGRAISLLNEYMRWGGFPEVWLYRFREKITSLLETIFYRDIVERRRIKSVNEFREVFYYVFFNYSNPVTWNSMKRLLRAQGIGVDVKTIMGYIEGMRQAFLLFVVYRYVYSHRRRAVAPKKIYLVDIGLTSLFSTLMDLGRRMENLIFLELMRRGFEEAIISIGRERKSIFSSKG